jgi:hypothetical protein
LGSSSLLPQAAILSKPGIATDFADGLQNGSLSYAADQSILEDAASGGMMASKIQHAPDPRIGVQHLGRHQRVALRAADHRRRDLRQFGARHLERWRATASTLGDLTAVSAQTHADHLIGEWFL